MPTSDYAAPDWSAIDTAKPLDWSKPAFDTDQPKRKKDQFIE